MLNKNNSYTLGIAAENLASQHFEGLGFSVVAQRYKTPLGELDLILKQNNQIVFAEVKARSKVCESILSQRQLARNYAAAEVFLAKHPEYQNYDCRFDLIVVTQDKICRHLINIA